MRVVTMLKQQLSACCDLLLPPACHLCTTPLIAQDADTLLCCTCRADIPPLASACRRCRKPLPSFDSTDHTCEACLRRPPPFSRVDCVGRYDGLLKTAIHRYKYRDNLPLAKPLGQLLVEQIPPGSAHCHDMVIPVPLHRSRLRRRGYNQALELARPVAKALALPLESQLLHRLRATPAQQGLPLRKRTSNLRGAFHCKGALAGQRVLLVDDVMTSGATVTECCLTLRQAGATDVGVAVLGRA